MVGEPDSGRKSRRRNLIWLEVLVIAAAGLAFSLMANYVSPRGLSLGRDYFPGKTGATPATHPGTGAPGLGTAAGTNSPDGSALATVAGRLAEKGLRVIDGPEAKQWFDQPQYAQELIVFIDARDDRHYQEGHVPGAYQFDRYYPEKHLAAVLPACATAEKIVVYCTGGNCEDSEFAALALKDAGVPAERLFVFVGGITQWSANGWPIELGERKSGNLQTQK
jgi:rhodanese-related sulfurtransferase